MFEPKYAVTKAASLTALREWLASNLNSPYAHRLCSWVSGEPVTPERYVSTVEIVSREDDEENDTSIAVIYLREQAQKDYIASSPLEILAEGDDIYNYSEQLAMPARA